MEVRVVAAISIRVRREAPFASLPLVFVESLWSPRDDVVLANPPRSADRRVLARRGRNSAGCLDGRRRRAAEFDEITRWAGEDLGYVAGGASASAMLIA
jgi:hypothetical protein